MVAFRLASFGGMVPAVDDRLLPDSAATYAKNTWLYTGDLSGYTAPRFIRNLVSSTAKRVFRIPNSPLEKANYNNSIWMEFQDETVTVIRAPMLQDSYNRYYWMGEDTDPTYNTLARIQSGQPPLKLGVPAPAAAPTVRSGSGYVTGFETATYQGTYYPMTFRYKSWTSVDAARGMQSVSRTSNLVTVVVEGQHDYAAGDTVKVTPSTYTNYAYVSGSQKFIASVSRTSNVSTVTTTAAHGYAVGQKVRIEPTTNGVLAPNGPVSTIGTVGRGAGVVTITTTAAHGLVVGQRVRITNAGTSFDGEFTITSTPTSTSFTYSKTGSDSTTTSVSGATAALLTTGFKGNFTITAVTSTTFSFVQEAGNVPSTVDTGTVGRVTTGFEGYFQITAVPTSNSFQFVSGGSDVTSVAEGGTVTKVELRTTTNASGGATLGNTTTEATDQKITVSRAYVYTYVTEYGEEGPPSPPTVRVGTVDEPWYVTLPTVPSSVSTNRQIDRFRLYRTITSASGVATFYQVAEFNISQTLFLDTVLDTDLTSGTQLESSSWSPPPDGLKGWVAMPNGIIAAWKDNELWFCEPYRPHAWPAEYQVSVDFPIVGLGVMGQTLIIATTGNPWAATGVRPAAVSLAKINTFEPCLARSSIISTPEAVMYASPNGLVAAVPGQVQNATAELIGTAEWQAFHDLSKVTALRFGTAYMAIETPGSTTKGFTIDPRQQRLGYQEIDFASAITSIDIDPWTDAALIVRDGKIYVWDKPNGSNIEPYVWRSKVFQLPKLDNFAAMKVYFSVPEGAPTLGTRVPEPTTLAPDMYGIIRVYAGNRLVASRELRASGEEMRLPSGYTTEFYQIEIEARVNIHNVQIASTSRELVSA